MARAGARDVSAHLIINSKMKLGADWVDAPRARATLFNNTEYVTVVTIVTRPPKLFTPTLIIIHQQYFQPKQAFEINHNGSGLLVNHNRAGLVLFGHVE